jgi:hypothetical protein
MTRAPLLVCVGCWLAALAVGGADPAAVSAAAAALVRPLALPFLWRGLTDAMQQGDPQEAFARAQLLLRATPGWADGHTVFAFRYALEGGVTVLEEAARARADADRLQVALAVLEAARPACGQREAEMLSAMAWLVELAVRQQPAIAALLGEDPVILADRYLEAAERLSGARMVREQRLYDLPRLVAAFLRAGDRDRALRLLDEGIVRCAAPANAGLAADWQPTLVLVRRALAGDPDVDRGALARDIRLQPLATFLR